MNVGTLASAAIGVGVGVGVMLLDGPRWAGFGFACVIYLMLVNIESVKR